MFSIIGNKIKKIRKIRGLTQKELGVAVGFDEKNADVRIAQYESGVRKPKDKNISAIADALKVNPKMLGHPDIDFFVCLVQSMFWFDDLLALKVGKINGDFCFFVDLPKTDVCLMLYKAFDEWHQKQEQHKNGDISEDEYTLWKYNYPI